MAIADRSGIPIACCLESASPHEVTLVEKTLKARFISEYPQILIGDKAYDSDALDAHLQRRFGVSLVAPHRSNRTRTKTQDGRTLRRYRRRWKVERFFAWLYNFRRVVIRYEHNIQNFLGFIRLAIIILLLRHF